MWKCVICDDENEMRKEICEHLTKFSKETGETFKVAEYASAEQLLFHLTEDTDLLFLDIKMDGISGMKAAHRIRERNNQLCIVFITTMVQYAMEGYKVHAYGFLQKPLQYAQFRLQMLDVLRHLRQRRGETILVRSDRESRSVDLSQIVYFEVLNHELRFKLTNDSFRSNGTLSELNSRLVGRGFLRCHKSYCVNLRHVQRVTQEGVQMSDGSIIPISKLRRKEFLDAFASYAGGNM